MDGDFDPRDWRNHRFGLSRDRWAALHGKAVWITGAGTGYGRALALALAAAGARVILSGRRRAKLEEVLIAADALGVNRDSFRVVTCDIADGCSLAEAVEVLRVSGLVPYGLVNNAALPQPAVGGWALFDTEPEQWSRLITTNLTAHWMVTRSVLPGMAAAGAARVLFISSEAGWASTVGFGPYNVSKAALNSLGMSFAAEAAARYPEADIQINVLVPGEARTEMNQGSLLSPFRAVPMALTLLSHGPGGPNGSFFHRDGRALAFGYSGRFETPLVDHG